MHHAIKCMQGEVNINELLAHCITSVAWSNSAGIPTLFVTDSQNMLAQRMAPLTLAIKQHFVLNKKNIERSSLP